MKSFQHIYSGIQKVINKSEPRDEYFDTVQGCLEHAIKVIHPANDFQTVISSRFVKILLLFVIA